MARDVEIPYAILKNQLVNTAQNLKIANYMKLKNELDLALAPQAKQTSKDGLVATQVRSTEQMKQACKELKDKICKLEAGSEDLKLYQNEMFKKSLWTIVLNLEDKDALELVEKLQFDPTFKFYFANSALSKVNL